MKCRLDENVKRVYVPITEISPLEKDDGQDVNMELDETLEPLTDTLDLSLIALEMLALALPDYPRSNDTDYLSISMGDDTLVDIDNKQNPFSILSTLKEKLK